MIPPQTADNQRLFDETEPLADIGCLDRRHAEWLRILRRTRAYPPFFSTREYEPAAISAVHNGRVCTADSRAGGGVRIRCLVAPDAVHVRFRLGGPGGGLHNCPAPGLRVQEEQG